MSSRRITVALVLVLLLILGVAAVPGASAGAAAPRYYLSLGDSIAAGWQPDASGVGQFTNQGYTDQLYRRMRGAIPGLQHVKLGCPGETTASMIGGGGPYAGLCGYGGTSQLNTALAFLAAHPGEVAFITIDIGVNDVLGCLANPSPYPDTPTCVRATLPGVGQRLGQILGALRAATAGAVPIVGMNYYNPYLATWLEGIPPDGAAGPAMAQMTTTLAGTYLNDATLEPVYAAFGVPVADVFAAFSSTRWQMVGGQPFNVFRICQLTWMCDAPPVGPNIHPKARGNAVITRTFQIILNDLGIG
jgi:lysophospholipase L1-like esterase